MKYIVYTLGAFGSLGIIFILFFSGIRQDERIEQTRPNVLFIAIDDLNNEIGALGASHAHTPNLDGFAAEGRLFSQHYVQVPTCGPSRAALLRGKRPTDQAYIPNAAILRTYEEWGHQSLPGWFQNHGYTTLSLGKISHYPGGLTGEGWAEGPEELPGVWDRAWVPDSPWETPEDMMHGYANGAPRNKGDSFDSGSPAWQAWDGPDESYPDAWVAKEAVEMLEELSEAEDPWFFGVGFFKPHLPFAAPKKYYDLHNPDRIPMPADTVGYEGPYSSFQPSFELLDFYGEHPGHPQTDEDYARQLRHAYAASTSYVDAQVGRVLDAVNRLGLDKNTIVVIWSDHGFLLGHQGIWGKHALYEGALKSPLIIRYPGMNAPGAVSKSVIETVDIFPTLTDLADLPAPEGLHGSSLRPQLEDHRTASSRPAFSFFRDGQTSVRNENWRLIQHREHDEVQGFELFDFRENKEGKRRNPDKYPEVIEKLRQCMETLPWQS